MERPTYSYQLIDFPYQGKVFSFTVHNALNIRDALTKAVYYAAKKLKVNPVFPRDINHALDNLRQGWFEMKLLPRQTTFNFEQYVEDSYHKSPRR